MESLEVLSLKGTKVTEIGTLLQLPNLYNVDLSGTTLDLSVGSEARLIINELKLLGVHVIHSPFPPGDDEADVHIPDPPYLEDAIRIQLGYQGRITPSVMEHLENLQNNESELLTNLKGLEYAINLRQVTLVDTRVSDLSPLENLPLSDLTLSNNLITDISILLAFPDLWFVDISGNPIDLSDGSEARDIIDQLLINGVEVIHDPLPPGPDDIIVYIPDENLNQRLREQLNYHQWDFTTSVMELVRDIFISNAGVQDLTGLEHATNLEFVFLMGNNISDISPLSGLRNIVHVDISENPLDLATGSLAREIIEELKADGVHVDHDPFPPGVDDVIIEIPDPELERRIRETLNYPEWPITQAAMESLRWLFIHDVEDLTGLEYAINLNSLQAVRCNLSDLNPIAELPNLWSAWINFSNLTDISALAGSTLRYLEFSNNSIESIAALVDMPALEWVYLGGNPLDLSSGSETREVIDILKSRRVDVFHDFLPPEQGDEIADIPDLALLRIINAQYNRNEYPITIAAMESIKGLNAGWHTFDDITDLTGLELAKNLTGLSLQGRNISDISLLAQLPNLEYLDLSNNKISDLSPLAALTNLEYLNINNNKVSDISSLSGLTRLRSLLMEFNNVNEVSTILNFPALEWLQLRGNPVGKTPDCPSWDIVDQFRALGAEVNTSTLIQLGPNDTDIELGDPSINIFIPKSISDSYSADTALTLRYQNVVMEIPASAIYDAIPDSVAYTGLTVRLNTLRAQNYQEQMLALATDSNAESPDLLLPDVFQALGMAFAFDMYAGDYRISQFAQPFNTTISFNPGVLDNYESVGFYRFNPDTGQWDLLPLVVNAAESTIVASIDHWSRFALLGELYQQEGPGVPEPDLPVVPDPSEPGEPSPEEPTDPVDSLVPEPGDSGKLPKTGTNIYWLLPIGLMISVAGMVIRRKLS